MKLFLVGLFAIAVSVLNAQDFCSKAKKIVEALNAHHLHPLELNDSLSSHLFSEFFFTVDPESEYFTKKDISDLSLFQLQLDNEVSSHSCKFIQASKDLFRKKVTWTRHLVDSLLKTPLDYTVAEGIFWGPSVPRFSVNKKELENRWRRKLKYEIEIAIYRNHERVNEKKDLTTAIFQSFEPAARQKVKARELRAIDQLMNDPLGMESFIEDAYMKAIARIFDPHSDYFSIAEMNDFQTHLNPEGLYFGISIGENALGEIQIDGLMPGSPAWKCNEIHEGDLLIDLKSNGKYYDALDYDVEEIGDLLDLPENQEAEISIRTTNGETKKVKLVKEKMENTENIVSSFVLKGKKTIGYIALPTFYKESAEGKQNGCANDVAKELIKLKNEKIEGLILDLRFNGGGFVQEAVELAGLFIDYGPLAIMQEKGEAAVSLKDASKGIVYDGPLAIMVNGSSASASELLAAALQDYNRAIIIGSKTYGKATGQLVRPVDDHDEKQGFLKITTDRIYRINGSSLQQRGVLPDIVLPDLTDIFVKQESSLRYSLTATATAKKVYYSPKTFFPKDKLQESSRERLSLSANFNAISKLRNFYMNPFSLEQKSFIKYVTDTNHLFTILEHEKNGQEVYSVLNNRMNKSLLQIDKYHDEINKQMLESVEKSIYIHEAYLILSDSVNK